MQDGDMELKINMSAQMTNEELRTAIADAYNRAGDANRTQKRWHDHMEALMEIQRGRAAACCVDNSNPAVRGRESSSVPCTGVVGG